MKTKSNLRACKRATIIAGATLALLVPNIAALGDTLAEPEQNIPAVITVSEETSVQPDAAVIAVNNPASAETAAQDPSVAPKEAALEQPQGAAPPAVNPAPESKPITVALPAPKKKAKVAAKPKPAAASPRKVAKKPAAPKVLAKKQAAPAPVVTAAAEIPQQEESGNVFSRMIERARSLVSNAFSWLGTRYVWGGTSRKGIDCSGLTRELYAKLGIKLPHSSRLQAKMGRKVSGNALQPGDLVFFNTKRGPNTHVGVYIGDGKFLHAANPKRGVRVDSLSSPYYSKRLAAARRYS